MWKNLQIFCKVVWNEILDQQSGSYNEPLVLTILFQQYVLTDNKASS